METEYPVGGFHPQHLRFHHAHRIGDQAASAGIGLGCADQLHL